MKNQFSNLGKALNQAEQKQITGGTEVPKETCWTSDYDEWCCKNLGTNCKQN